MKTLILAAVLTAGLAAAVPAAAQSWGDQGRFGGPSAPSWGDRGRFGGQGASDGRERMIEMRIDRGVRDGSLTRSEARSLSNQLDDLRRLEWRFQRDGRVSYRESDELDRRFDALEQRLRVERRDRDFGSGPGYGRGEFGGYR